MVADSHVACAFVSTAFAISHCPAVTGSVESVIVESVVFGGSASIVPVATAGLSGIPIGSFGGGCRVIS